MSEPSPWDLRVYGEPVRTVDDLLHWLNAHALSRPSQLQALGAWRAMNRRAIPDDLRAELDAFMTIRVDTPFIRPEDALR